MSTKVKAFYPVVCVGDVDGAARFFERHFGFRRAFSADWFVHLVRPSGEEDDGRVEQLAFVHETHETVPARGRVGGQGLLLSIEVEDARAMWEALSQDVEVLLPLRDEEFGQRHFILQGPEGCLVDVIQMIPASEAFRSQYTEVTV